MFNLKQDDDVTRGFVKKKKLNWSRLKFAIYIKLSNDQYERVSPPIFSDLIKNSIYIIIEYSYIKISSF
jgi:hypothetical protein